MKPEHSTLSELIADLRRRANLTHAKVGAAIHRTRWASQHYEEGRSRPPVGYVAFIARAAHERGSRTREPRAVAEELLGQVNAAVALYYGHDDTLASWGELCALADRWLEENRRVRHGDKPAAKEAERGDTGVAQPPLPIDAPVAPAPHWQLRAATPDFVGREVERGRLVSALRGRDGAQPRAALACVRGLGGAGKTELAYRVAQELAGDFPDGQLLLELRGSIAPLQPEEALARVVQAFEPQQALPQALASLRSLYRTALHGRRVLIVADDARDAAQVRELLPPPGSALLITSRWRFALEGLGDANLIELGGLAVDEAARLVLGISPRIGAAAPELASLCGSLPLALRIAGGRLASDRTLRVERFLAELRDERSRLAALEGDDAEHSVAAVLNLSYQALEPTARSMLAQLSVFPASFSRDALPGVVLLEGAPGPDLDQALSQLHRAGLVELDAEGERVWLHDLVRAFAALHHHEPDELRRRLAATYGVAMYRLNVAVSQGGAATLLPALAFFDAERANVELGLRWAIEHADEPESAQTLTDFVLGIPAIGAFRCHPLQVLRPLYIAGLQMARRLQEPVLELVTLNNLGVIESNLGNDAEAERLFIQAQTLVTQVAPDEERFRPVFQHNLAKSYMGQGDYDRARSIAEELLQSAIARQHPEAHIRALLVLGRIERRSDRPERAVRYGEEALVIARSLGHRHLERLVLGNLANAVTALPATAETSAELYARAVGYASEALAISEQLDDVPGQVDALTVLGNAATLHGDPRVAVERQQQALAAARAQGYDHQVAAILVNLGDAYRALREGELAADAYEQGVRAYETLNDPYGLARACWRYGALVVRLHEFAGTSPSMGQARRAALLWERAVELERANNLPTAQEHAATLGHIQRWIAAHGEGAEQ